MKTLLGILLVFSIALGNAQNSTIDNLVADFERGKALSLAYIEAMPEDKYSFKPDEDAMSFSTQMLHMAQGTAGLASNGTGAEKLFSGILAEDKANHSKEAVKRLTEESFNYVIKTVSEMDPDTFGEMVERGPFNVSRLGWVQKAKEHLSHHRGQTAIYLRLVGVTPPQYKLF